jgi:hypothetical protein
MSGVSVDHVVSVIVLLAAIVLFVGLFDQTLTAAVNYQYNTTTAKECDNLIDEILLTNAPPLSGAPSWFGMQDSSLATYNLDPFALMRLDSIAEAPISYQKTGQTYSAITTSPENYLLYPYSDMITYSTALGLLGLQSTYGFQLSLTPTVNVAITEVSTSPLKFSLTAKGTGFILADATVNSLLVPISLNGNCPKFETPQSQTNTTSVSGQAYVSFNNFYPNQDSTFAFVAFVYLDGIAGIGYYVNSPVGSQSIIPFLDPLSTMSVTLANSNDVQLTSANAVSMNYNTTFIFESGNYAFEENSLASSYSSGSVTSGPGNSPVSLSMSSYTPGILVIAYQNTGNNGVVLMPWGFSSIGFSLRFGGTPINQGWVATDIRQVEINSVSYQATLSLWSTQSHGGLEGIV